MENRGKNRMLRPFDIHPGRKGLMDLHRRGSLNCEFVPSDRNKVLKLLTQHIAQLPPISKKVLALYYYENLQPAERATGLGLTENQIERIRTQTVRLLLNKLVGDLKRSDRPVS
jgi:DNA-directed RNA polymerase specialized sigma24 family protein